MSKVKQPGKAVSAAEVKSTSKENSPEERIARWIALGSLVVPALLFYVGWSYESERLSRLGLNGLVDGPETMEGMAVGGTLLLWVVLILALLVLFHSLISRTEWARRRSVSAKLHPLAVGGAVLTASTTLAFFGAAIGLGQSKELDIAFVNIAYNDIFLGIAGVMYAVGIAAGFWKFFSHRAGRGFKIAFGIFAFLANLALLGGFGSMLGADVANDQLWRCVDSRGIEITAPSLGMNESTFMFLAREDGMLFVRDADLDGDVHEVQIIDETDVDRRILRTMRATRSC